MGTKSTLPSPITRVGTRIRSYGVSVTSIRYQFNAEGALQASAYLLSRLGGTSDKIKLMKLLYLADRDHFLAHGRPITGDVQYALPHGPVPSCTLNLLSGQDAEQNDFVFRHIESTNRTFNLVCDPGATCLGETDRAVLDAVLAKYGKLHTGAIRNLTHKLPEYVECEVEGSSAPIPYEVILKHHGGPNGFRMGRPVISPQMSSHMLCPFPASEPDL